MPDLATASPSYYGYSHATTMKNRCSSSSMGQLLTTAVDLNNQGVALLSHGDDDVGAAGCLSNALVVLNKALKEHGRAVPTVGRKPSRNGRRTPPFPSVLKRRYRASAVEAQHNDNVAAASGCASSDAAICLRRVPLQGFPSDGFVYCKAVRIPVESTVCTAQSLAIYTAVIVTNLGLCHHRQSCSTHDTDDDDDGSTRRRRRRQSADKASIMYQTVCECIRHDPSGMAARIRAVALNNLVCLATDGHRGNTNSTSDSQHVVRELRATLSDINNSGNGNSVNNNSSETFRFSASTVRRMILNIELLVKPTTVVAAAA